MVRVCRLIVTVSSFLLGTDAFSKMRLWFPAKSTKNVEAVTQKTELNQAASYQLQLLENRTELLALELQLVRQGIDLNRTPNSVWQDRAELLKLVLDESRSSISNITSVLDSRMKYFLALETSLGTLRIEYAECISRGALREATLKSQINSLRRSIDRLKESTKVRQARHLEEIEWQNKEAKSLQGSLLSNIKEFEQASYDDGIRISKLEAKNGAQRQEILVLQSDVDTLRWSLSELNAKLVEVEKSHSEAELKLRAAIDLKSKERLEAQEAMFEKALDEVMIEAAGQVDRRKESSRASHLEMSAATLAWEVERGTLLQSVRNLEDRLKVAKLTMERSDSVWQQRVARLESDLTELVQLRKIVGRSRATLFANKVAPATVDEVATEFENEVEKEFAKNKAAPATVDELATEFENVLTTEFENKVAPAIVHEVATGFENEFGKIANKVAPATVDEVATGFENEFGMFANKVAPVTVDEVATGYENVLTKEYVNEVATEFASKAAQATAYEVATDFEQEAGADLEKQGWEKTLRALDLLYL